MFTVTDINGCFVEFQDVLTNIQGHDILPFIIAVWFIWKAKLQCAYYIRVLKQSLTITLRIIHSIHVRTDSASIGAVGNRFSLNWSAHIDELEPPVS